MNKSSSLERRYSFNMGQGGHVAESTHLNGSNFSWGSVNSKLRGYSNLSISSTNSYSDCDLIANSNTHVTKVDARIAADVQSKGLASRIVKYHDNGTRLIRSISAHNLFSKPGQFPLVTLKKTNLPYRAAKRELSMIRIPPPNKSSYYGNTVSGLMRSSSVIGLQSTQNEVLSTENRPIIHPPPTENDMAPTRSVLDVLKEISRKRINSDEVDFEEMSKKYCSHASNDFVVAVANKALTNEQDYLASPTFSPCQRHKRQRDCMTLHQGIQLLETKTSPEQAKKRVCNYNNDITSSLSSSIKSKKISISRNVNKTLPRNFQSYETQKSEVQGRLEHQKNTIENNRNNFPDSNCMTETAIGHGEIKSTVAPQRNVSEFYFNSDENVGSASKSVDQHYKPRLTLFNKKYDKNESLHETCELEEKFCENFNDEDCAGIPFVKPKKITSKVGLRNPVMERTQKSKLALMLSGLRGEVYQNTDFDVIDSSSKREELQIATNNSTNLPNLSGISTNNITTLTTSTSTTVVTSISNVETTTDVKKSLSPSSLVANKSSPLVGLKLKPATEDISSVVSANTSKITDFQSKTNVPVLRGFSFGTTSSSSTSPVHTCFNLNTEFEVASTQIASVPLINNIVTSKQLSDSVTSDKISNMSGNVPLTIKNKIEQFPAICKASTTPDQTRSIANISVSSSSLGNLPISTTAKSNSVSSPPSSAASTEFGTSTVPIAKPINAFNFIVPCTSSPISVVSCAPLLFGSSTTSANLTKTAVSSENAFSPPTSSLLHFNKKSSIGESAKISNEAISAGTFSIDGNKPINSTNLFGTVTDSTTTALDTVAAFSFNSDAKIQGNGDKGNDKAENKVFNSCTPALSDSQCFNNKRTENSISVVNNTTSSNNFFNLPGSAIFGPNCVPASSEVFGSNSNEKTAASVAPVVFGNDKSNKTMPFSFGSTKVTFTAKSPLNVNTNTGGFSFNSPVAKSVESGEKITSSSTFSDASVSAAQNNFTFGSSNNTPNSTNIFGTQTNKQSENLAQGGFAFGATAPLKTSTFSFGAGKSPETDNGNANNRSTSGFTFGTPSTAKQNVLSNNKPFSFGLPQPTNQKQSESTNVANSLNIFGLSSSSKVTQPPTFSFTSANSQPNAPPTNIFTPSISNVTTGPGDRPIRRATRRLQK